QFVGESRQLLRATFADPSEYDEAHASDNRPRGQRWQRHAIRSQAEPGRHDALESCGGELQPFVSARTDPDRLDENQVGPTWIGGDSLEEHPAGRVQPVSPAAL